LLLIVTCIVTPRWKQPPRSRGIETIWDFDDLLSQAYDTSVYGELKTFLADLGVGDRGTLGEAPVADELGESTPTPTLGKGWGYAVALSDRLWVGGYRLHSPESVRAGNYQLHVPPSTFTRASSGSAHDPDAGDFDVEAILAERGEIPVN